MKKFKKTINLIMCLVLVANTLMNTEIVTASENTELNVRHDGNTVSQVSISKNDAVLIDVEPIQENSEYAWQILIKDSLNSDNDKGIWVDIQGQSGTSLNVTYAMVCSQLSSENTVKIRVCEKTGDGNTKFSNEVEVVVIDEEPRHNDNMLQEKRIENATKDILDIQADENINYSDVKYTNEQAEETLSGNSVPDNCTIDNNNGEDGLLGEGDGLLGEEDELLGEGDGELQEPDIALYSRSIQNNVSSSDVMEIAEATAEYVTITITYKFEEGTNAFEPYLATLLKGTSFTSDVVSPSIVGYEPVIIEEDGSRKDATTVYIDYSDGVNENTIINVVYQPSLVKYSIKYFFQNIFDDLYSEDTYKSITDAEGYTGDYPDYSYFNKLYDGFSVLGSDNDEIAADGSSEYHVYYNRNYYLMNFLLDGGYGVEPIYAKYDSSFVVNNPTKHGYIFSGWDLLDTNGTGDNVADTLPNNLPSENRSYKALWKAEDTTYQVVYWKENADDDGYSYWGEENIDAVSSTKVSGSDRASVLGLADAQYFEYNAALTDKDVIVDGDGSTVVNVYYTRKVFNLYFRGISGLCQINEHTHTSECAVLKCGYEDHEHSDECIKKLTCPINEHLEHTEECLRCTKEEHIHGDINCQCNIEEHIHKRSCFYISGSGTISSSKVTNANTISNIENSTSIYQNGLVKSVRSGGTTYYYIKIEGSWYRITNYRTSGGTATKITTNCGYSVEHTHGTGECSCDKEEHEHSELCYKDAIHQHSDNCYTYSCGKTSHSHTDECYGDCSVIEHTHTNTCKTNSTNNIIWVITAKYEQTIGNVWPTADKFPNVTLQGWSVDDVSSMAVSKRINMTADLCDTSDGLKYAQANTGGNKKYLYYMFESFDQESDEDGDNRKLYNGVYYDKSPLYQQEVNSSSSSFNQKQILGMTPVSGGVDTEGNKIFLYYTRNRYSFTFYNINDTVKTIDNIMYEQPLNECKDENGNLIKLFEPDYPDTYEPNAYIFDKEHGWYTTPECYAGTEVQWDTATMPASDLIAYANWTAVKHSVTVYKTYADAIAEKDEYAKFYVDHRNVVNPPESFNTPEMNNYTFNGWFYINENGEKVAFNFQEYAVTRDLIVFADWSSDIIVEYNIDYFYKDSDGNEIKIADVTTGSAFAGTTKTFKAKSGYRLYKDYGSHYYPKTNTHSIFMDANSSNNTYKFEYIYLDKVPYTVRYINKITGKELKSEKYIENNTSSIVTEKFEYIKGYVPDSYYKKLILSATESENIITFYYVPDSEHAYYAVHHYIQDTDGSYTEYAVIEGVGNIGDEIVVDKLTITGFAFNEELSSDRGNVNVQGLRLNMYYDRNKYDYTVNYLEYGTNKKLQESITGKAEYDSIINESAITIKGYSLISNQDASITIKDNPVLNVINFYYKLEETTIQYRVVVEGSDTTEYCNVSISQEIVNTPDNIVGSTPIVTDNRYIFDYWYVDRECTIRVDDDLVDSNGRITPELKTAVYYARFIPLVSSLRITNAGADTDIDKDQSFLYIIKGVEGTSTEGIELTVSIQGNNSVVVNELPIGEYKVEGKDSWYFRYTPDSKSKNIALDVDPNNNELVFNNTRDITKWLDGNSFKSNTFN